VTPHHATDTVTLYAGDCLDVLRELPDCSVDAVCTDPPYSLSFMGRTWDSHSLDRHRSQLASRTGPLVSHRSDCHRRQVST
jgi:site-specific DNA-methyltransferase (adenine-specific)